jgi:hypothetical protein
MIIVGLAFWFFVYYALPFWAYCGLAGVAFGIGIGISLCISFADTEAVVRPAQNDNTSPWGEVRDRV